MKGNLQAAGQSVILCHVHLIRMPQEDVEKPGRADVRVLLVTIDKNARAYRRPLSDLPPHHCGCG